MKKAPRSPSRWTSAGLRTLALVTLSSAVGACSVVDNTLYGNRQGTVEYPGSGAPPGASTVYIVMEKDTVDGVANRFGVAPQSLIDRNKLKPPYQLRAGQQLDISGARRGCLSRWTGQEPDSRAAAFRSVRRRADAAQPAGLRCAVGSAATLRMAGAWQSSVQLWAQVRRAEERWHRHPGGEGCGRESRRLRHRRLCRQRSARHGQPAADQPCQWLHHRLCP